MPAPKFLGYGDDGAMRFEGPNGAPFSAAPTPDAVIVAQQSLYSQGADPMGALPPKPSLEDRGALAANGAFGAPSKFVIDTGAAPGSGSGTQVGLGGPVFTPAPALQPKSVLETEAAKAEAMGGAQAAGPQAGPVPYQIADGPKRVAVPTEAPAAGPGPAPMAQGGFVPTPQRGGTTAGPMVPTYSGDEAEAERARLMGINRGMMAAEINKRPGRAQVIPEHEQKTDRATQSTGGLSDEAFKAQQHANQLKDKADRAAAFWANGDREEALETEQIRQQAEVDARAKAEEKLAKLRADEAKDRAEFDAMGVNPQRYWSSKSAEQKATAVLGMIFSGMGAGPNGRNLAIEHIDKAIEQDIAAQKDAIAKKKDKLDNYYDRAYARVKEETGSDVAATMTLHAARVAQVRAAAAQMARESGSDRIAAEQQKLDAMLAQREADLLKERDGHIVKSEHFRVIPKQVVGGGGTNWKLVHEKQKENYELARGARRENAEVGKIAADTAKDAKGKAPAVVNVGGVQYPVPEGTPPEVVTAAEKQLAGAKALESALGEVEQNGTGVGNWLKDKAGMNGALGTRRVVISGALAQGSGSGVPSESDKQDAEAIVRPGLAQAEAIAAARERAKVWKNQALERLGVRPGGKQ